MTKSHADEARVHERESEQQDPMDQPPAACLRDRGELRGAIAGEHGMKEAGDSKQQSAEEQAETVEERTARHDHGALI